MYKILCSFNELGAVLLVERYHLVFLAEFLNARTDEDGWEFNGIRRGGELVDLLTLRVDQI